MTSQWDAASERLLRELAPQVLGAVARRFRDFAVGRGRRAGGDAGGVPQWPQEGVPENPRGWLIQVASRRMTDQVRSEIARRERETAIAQGCGDRRSSRCRDRGGHGSGRHADSALHVLPPGADFVLGDRARRCGRWADLTTAEIANAFLVPEATMAQRISRAKQSIKASGVPFRAAYSRRSAASGCRRFCMCST